MTSVMRLGCVAGLALATACGPLNENSMGATAGGQLAKLVGLSKAEAPKPPAIPTEALAAGPGNVLMVTLQARNAVAAMTPVGRNKDVITWITPKGVTLSFQEGILVASRGLNEDLMGADLTGVHRAIVQGTGSARRVHSYLDSEDQTVIRDLSCSYQNAGDDMISTLDGQSPAIKIIEDCKSSGLVFQNNYWIDRIGGDIVQSLQAVAPTVGYIKVNPL